MKFSIKRLYTLEYSPAKALEGFNNKPAEILIKLAGNIVAFWTPQKGLLTEHLPMSYAPLLDRECEELVHSCLTLWCAQDLQIALYLPTEATVETSDSSQYAPKQEQPGEETQDEETAAHE